MYAFRGNGRYRGIGMRGRYPNAYYEDDDGSTMYWRAQTYIMSFFPMPFALHPTNYFILCYDTHFISTISFKKMTVTPYLIPLIFLFSNVQARPITFH